MAGYVAALIEKEDIKRIKELSKEIYSKEDLYYSDVVSHIQGDVIDDLHLTLYYGFADEVNKEEINKYISTLKLSELKLGELRIKSGYQDLYKLILVDVLDEEGYLDQISKGFKEFDDETEWQYEIKPHLTLAYVKPEFELTNIPHLPTRIGINNIKYFN